ncbi:hypothetical protein C8F01DRAFT_1079005 [Mycena amicta]|nr:hypothetical protein C8F01DRAFT_1079005 [Mycena amicta]
MKGTFVVFASFVLAGTVFPPGMTLFKLCAVSGLAVEQRIPEPVPNIEVKPTSPSKGVFFEFYKEDAVKTVTAPTSEQSIPTSVPVERRVDAVPNIDGVFFEHYAVANTPDEDAPKISGIDTASGPVVATSVP